MSTTVNLENIRLRHSSLTDSIYLCRFGKNPCLALDKREAESDAITVVIQHMMHDAPKGSSKKVRIDGQWYSLTVQPLAGEHDE